MTVELENVDWTTHKVPSPILVPNYFGGYDEVQPVFFRREWDHSVWTYKHNDKYIKTEKVYF